MSVTMGKGEFKLYLCNVIDSMDEDSVQYSRFSELFLTATGVIDADGNLTEDYACSPYWTGGNNGTPLRPSVEAELLSKLSPDVREAIVKMDMDQKARANA